jgi:diketogulonate reductase-like aldo/keto reductase
MIHWPGIAGKKPHDEGNAATRLDTWAELQRLHSEGKCRALGVSNFLPHHLDELCAWEGCTVPPVGEYSGVPGFGAAEQILVVGD